MIKIYDWQDRPATVPSNPGSDEVIEYERLDDGRGNLTFPVVGSHSQSEYIQSFAHECDLEMIVKQAEMSGNPGLLVRDGGSSFYGDITDLPDNRIDLANTSDRAVAYWAQHSADLPFDTFDDFIAGKVSSTKFGQTAVSGEQDHSDLINHNAQKEDNK